MQEVENHILSAEEVVDEVYVSSTVKSPAHGSATEEEQILLSNRRMTKEGSHNFRVVRQEPGTILLKNGPSLSRLTKLHGFDRARPLNTKKGTSRRLKRKPICDLVEVLDHGNDEPLRESVIYQSNVRKPHTLVPDLNLNTQVDRPTTSVPGPSSNPEEPEPRIVYSNLSRRPARRNTIFPGSSFGKGNSDDRRLPDQPGASSLAEYPKVSKRREFAEEVEETEVQIRTRKEHTPAQLKDWESFKDEVAAVQSIWSQLDHARIYATSTVDIKELTSKQHPSQRRLWSWSKGREGTI